MRLHKRQTEKNIQNYKFFKSDLLGKGFSSSVYKGINENDQSTVAIKVIDLRAIKQSTMKTILQSQVKIIRSLSHPNILQCKDIFITVNNCYIITQLCRDGDLSSMLKKKGRLRGLQALKVIMDVLNAYIYLKGQNILHRDLKPANILMDNGTAKIADFGFACYQNDKNFQKYNVGTPLYMSPQSLISNKSSQKSDIWSLGIIFYEILQGRHPWDVRSQKQLKSSLKQKKQVIFKIAIMDEIEEMIKKCLSYKSEERISAEEMKQIVQKIMKQMQVEDTSAYRGTLTKRPSNYLTQRKSSNSTIQTMERPVLESKIKKVSLQQNHNIIRKTTQQLQQRIVKGKQNRKIRVHSVQQYQQQQQVQQQQQQQKITSKLQQASRYNHSLLKAGINLTRFIYKLIPRIQDLYAQEQIRLLIKSQIMKILLPLIKLLQESVKDKKVGQLLGLQEYDSFSKTVCFTKTTIVLTQYKQRYIKYANKQFSSLQCYDYETILNNGNMMDILKLLIGNLPLNSKTSQKHNICVDYLVSLVSLLQIVRGQRLMGIVQRGQLQQVINTMPMKLSASNIQELGTKRKQVCNSHN